MRMMFLFLLFIFFIAVNPAYASDIEIKTVKVTYKDDMTTPGKVTIRELKKFSDDPYWSKPEKVNVIVELKNNSKKKTVKVRVYPELYVLIKRVENSPYPPIQTKLPAFYGETKELKSLSKGYVWVWNRVLKSRPPIKIAPQKTMSVRFSDVDISNPYYPTDYSIAAISIRVFAELMRGKDPNYSNNVADHVVMYGD